MVQFEIAQNVYYFYQNESKYKTVLQQCRQGESRRFDVTPLINFGIEGFALELKGINSFIKTKLNRVVYRNMLLRAYNRRVGERRRLLNDREYHLLDFLITETEPTDPFSENPSRRLKFSDLSNSKYVQAAYRDFTPRTFFRERIRLEEMGFISTSRGGQTILYWSLISKQSGSTKNLFVSRRFPDDPGSRLAQVLFVLHNCAGMFVLDVLFKMLRGLQWPHRGRMELLITKRACYNARIFAHSL